MKRIFRFYFIWKSEKLETFLSKMEENGFRLDYVSFRYFFTFRRAKPKSVRYVYSYTFLRDCEIMQYEYDIRRQYAADVVPVYHSGLMRIHRIPDSQADLSDFEAKKNRYMRRVLRQKVFFLLSVLLGTVCGFLVSERTMWVFLLLAGIAAFFVGIQIWGILYLRSKREKI